MEIVYAVIEQNQLIISSTPADNVLAVHLSGTIKLQPLLAFLTTPLIYADAESRFDLSQPELFTEINNEIGAVTALVARVGKAAALELLLGNQVINAAQADRLGLINEILPGSEFQPRLAKIAKLSLTAIELAIDISQRGQRVSHAQAERLERYAFALRFAHPDQQEGMRAFLQKRAPKFTG